MIHEREREVLAWLDRYPGKSKFVADLRSKMWRGEQLTANQIQALADIKDDPRSLKQKVDEFLAGYHGDYKFLVDIKKLWLRDVRLSMRQMAAVDKCRRNLAQHSSQP